MKIAFIVPNVSHKAGPPGVAACLIEKLGDDHEIAVFSHTIEDIDLTKIRHYQVPAIKYPKLLEEISFFICSTVFLAVIFLFKKKDYDIIHAHGYSCAVFARVITSHFCEIEGLRLEKTDVISMPRSSLLLKMKAVAHMIYRSYAALLERLTFGANRSRSRIVVSQSMKNEFIRHFGEAARDIIVIPNGVDLEVFNPANRPRFRDNIRRMYNISPKTMLLMFAGSDWERKGVPCIIEALPLLVERDIRLLIIGSGSEKFYGRLAESRMVRDKIIFAESQENIREYYSASDIFVFPTRYEPFGLVIVEAMASGLPVVTSRLAGAAEYITDGVDGLLLDDPGDIRELAAKINRLAGDAGLRQTMGERARKTAEGLSWDSVAARTVEVYNKLRLKGNVSGG